MRLAFDSRSRRRPESSFARVLDLLEAAARSVDLAFEEWNAGACKADVLWSPALEAPAVRGPRLVLTLHDVNPLHADGRPWFLRLRREVVFRRKARGGLLRAWRVATDSEHARGEIEAAFPGFGPLLRVVPLFAHPHMTPGPPDADRLERLGLEPGYLLFLGALRRHKNWECLVRAYARLPAALRRAHPLVLAGSARRAARRAENLIRALELAGQVRLTGVVPEEALPSLYRGAALFVFPSLAEGFGLPPLEAMACGAPVAASRAASLPEVLGDAALWFDPADPAALAETLVRALETPGLREELVEKGRRRAATFHPGRTGAAMKALLEGSA